MNKILLVEDSQFFQSVIRKAIEKDGRFEIISATNMEMAQKLLDKHQSEIFVALLDVTLPDAPDGEVVTLFRSRNIPSIVFSARYEEDMRKKLFDLGVIDYIIKSSPSSLGYVKNLMERLAKNKGKTALVVDEDPAMRERFSTLLSRCFMKVLPASSVAEAQTVLERLPDLRLVMLSNRLGGDDEAGYKLLQDIRKNGEKDLMVVIGLAGGKDPSTVARFLKYGANDYLGKDCTQEEFISRITQNLDMVDRMRALMDAANQDFMTGLYNRRFLYDAGGKLYDTCRRANEGIAVAVMDIDHFKKVNDTYGHDAGDYVIKKVAGILAQNMRGSDIVSRMGGEEFCIVASNMKPGSEHTVFDKIRQNIEEANFEFDGIKIPVTISIGVCTAPHEKLSYAITAADENLYRAKQAGRNKVVIAA